jgi:type IV pilus assembly protein PilA
MSNRGFTLIELLVVVVIIGILAAIAIPKFANSKEKAVLASMKSDLRNLVTAQEGFYFDNSDYAGGLTAGPQVNGTGGTGLVPFIPSSGNVVVFSNVTNTGYTATVTNPVLQGGITTCGVYIGPVANRPNPQVTQEGAPACY